MEFRQKTTLGVLLATVCAVPLTHAAGTDATERDTTSGNTLGVAVHGGTLGAGLSLEYGFAENWDARIGFNTLSVDHDIDTDDQTYDTDIDLESGSALLDWHPFSGYFHLTGGVMLNNNEATAKAQVSNGDEVGGYTLKPGQSGKLKGDVSFDDAAPYLGIGWSSSVRRADGLSFSVDVGAMYQGSPDVDLDVQSNIAGVSDSDVNREESDLEDEVEDYKWYPVVQIGLNYRF